MPLGWIDFSKSERNKVLSVLELLSEQGTLDELGIAPIRDGFSELFFPGTTTIQTRAKYFFIIPYALRDLELGKETNPAKAMRELDQIEQDCGKTFLKNNPGMDGIIGSRALASGGWVKQAPSRIYWAGLRKYGFFFNLHCLFNIWHCAFPVTTCKVSYFLTYFFVHVRVGRI